MPSPATPKCGGSGDLFNSPGGDVPGDLSDLDGVDSKDCKLTKGQGQGGEGEEREGPIPSRD
ncbi:uncharacterized protein N7518_007126 [Penicillium psychrosexuale]|uniref:uncharacterized protein n=1 Tax=Penicillium psychrosexuale TaxID=1002107 RepID=UPI0025451AE9|nr:uncharacterized protein N7518_007126 [Penicillium psychrosexuale]KAJ5790115.1 hypothetical protein N7518_007126 [Penicillium psychrosexuale]